MNTLITALLIVFTNPTGNSVIANSSQLLQHPDTYASIEECDAAPLPEFQTVINETGDEFTFRIHKACFATVPESEAGAHLVLLRATQNQGLRIQFDGQSVALPVADKETCNSYVDMLGAIQTPWETDLPQHFAAACI